MFTSAIAGKFSWMLVNVVGRTFGYQPHRAEASTTGRCTDGLSCAAPLLLEDKQHMKAVGNKEKKDLLGIVFRKSK